MVLVHVKYGDGDRYALFQALAYLADRSVEEGFQKMYSVHDLLSEAMDAMQECSSPARAAQLLDMFAVLYEYVSGCNWNPGFDAADFAKDVFLFTHQSEWAAGPQHHAEMLRRSCLTVEWAEAGIERAVADEYIDNDDAHAVEFLRMLE